MTTFQIAWFGTLIVLFGLFVVIGVRCARRPLGILIDDRQKMSLSRLQIVLWSWLLISAFFAVAITFMTMNIEMSPQIWALMGISVGSAAGSVIVKGTKSNQEPAATVAALPANVTRQGILPRNADAKDACWAELFCGEEMSTYKSVDISKVQMFFFTLATVFGYAMILWNFPFELKDAVVKFPELSSSLVTLLGISHAGYLTVKAAPKTPTA